MKSVKNFSKVLKRWQSVLTHNEWRKVKKRTKKIRTTLDRRCPSNKWNGPFVCCFPQHKRTFVFQNANLYFITQICSYKSIFALALSTHSFVFQNANLYFKTQICIYKSRFTIALSTYSFVFQNANLYFKTQICIYKRKFVMIKHKFVFSNAN